MCGARFKLGVKLATQHKGMIDQFSNFDQSYIWREPAEHKSSLHQQIAIGIVHFKAMAMSFLNSSSPRKTKPWFEARRFVIGARLRGGVG